MKLRALRTKKRLTLSRLAMQTGLSVALLSKLENGQMIPTLSTLAAISQVYGVGLSYFFCEPESQVISITRRAHLHDAEPNRVTATATPINMPDRNGCLSAETVDIASCTPITLDNSEAGTRAFIYVLEGRLRLCADASDEVLEAGDCAYIYTGIALFWSAVEKDRCRILIVRPPGTRAE